MRTRSFVSIGLLVLIAGFALAAMVAVAYLLKSGENKRLAANGKPLDSGFKTGYRTTFNCCRGGRRFSISGSTPTIGCSSFQIRAASRPAT